MPHASAIFVHHISHPSESISVVSYGSISIGDTLFTFCPSYDHLVTSRRLGHSSTWHSSSLGAVDWLRVRDEGSRLRTWCRGEIAAGLLLTHVFLSFMGVLLGVALDRLRGSACVVNSNVTELVCLGADNVGHVLDLAIDKLAVLDVDKWREVHDTGAH